MQRYLPLICLALTHTIVDACALLVAPLWPGLEKSFGWGMAGLSLAFIVQSLPTSISQAVFGYFRDRRATPLWLWLGPVLAALFLPLVGIATETAVLFALLIVGGIGVGAFHPEAAVVAGRMFPGHRTRALSIFLLGGAMGLALGPVLSGLVVTRWGLSGLVVLVPPLVMLIFILRHVGGLGGVSETVPRKEAAVSVAHMLEGRIGLAVVILLVCSLRLVPNMAMDKVLSFALSQRGYSVAQVGWYQSLFLISASAGMFVMAFRFRPGLEKAFMVVCPLAGIPLVYLLGLETTPPAAFTVLLVLAGLILWGTTPAMVSYAQQQFPKGAGLASAITMGLSWGLGGLIQAPITAYFQSTGHPQHALHAFIPCLFVAAAGAYFLPSARTQEATGESAGPVAALGPEPVDA